MVLKIVWELHFCAILHTYGSITLSTSNFADARHQISSSEYSGCLTLCSQKPTRHTASRLHKRPAETMTWALHNHCTWDCILGNTDPMFKDSSAPTTNLERFRLSADYVWVRWVGLNMICAEHTFCTQLSVWVSTYCNSSYIRTHCLAPCMPVTFWFYMQLSDQVLPDACTFSAWLLWMQMHRVAVLTWMTIEGHNASSQVFVVHIFPDHVGVFPPIFHVTVALHREDSTWGLCQVSMSSSVYTCQHVCSSMDRHISLFMMSKIASWALNITCKSCNEAPDRLSWRQLFAL